MSKDKIDFEKLFSELEDIVKKMESGEITLSESLELFERGVKIAKILREHLDSIEKRVELLIKDQETGEILKEDFTTSEDDKTEEDDELPF